MQWDFLRVSARRHDARIGRGMPGGRRGEQRLMRIARVSI